MHVSREVAEVRVHSLADASHGQPLTVETKSPKALGVTRVHSLVTPTSHQSATTEGVGAKWWEHKALQSLISPGNRGLPPPAEPKL